LRASVPLLDLERVSDLFDQVSSPGVGQRALDGDAATAHDADDEVLEEIGLRLRRAPAVVLAIEPDDGVGDTEPYVARGRCRMRLHALDCTPCGHAAPSLGSLSNVAGQP